MSSHRRGWCRHFSALLITLGIVLGALPSSAVAQDTLEKIRSAGKISVATEAAFPPFEFIQDGKIVGYGKDILDYIVADLGVELEQVDVPFPGLFPGLLAGQFDLIATTLSMGKLNTEKFAFTMPIAEGSPSVLKRKGDGSIASIEDLNGKIVGVQVATGSERQLRDLDAKFRGEGKPGFEIRLFNSGPESYLALANQQVDAAASLLPSIQALAAKQPDVYEVVGPLFPEKLYLGWAVRPEDTALRDYLNSQIKELRDSGKLYELQDKWFGMRMEIPDEGYLPEGSI
jgi:polar amino acid transport system substrate-binding protein